MGSNPRSTKTAGGREWSGGWGAVFDPQPSQFNEIYTCLALDRIISRIGKDWLVDNVTEWDIEWSNIMGNDWLAQCQDNVTESDIDLVEQHHGQRVASSISG